MRKQVIAQFFRMIAAKVYRHMEKHFAGVWWEVAWSETFAIDTILWRSLWWTLFLDNSQLLP